MLFVEFLLFLARIPWWNHIWWTYVHVLWIHKNNLNTLSKRIKWMSFFFWNLDKKNVLQHLKTKLKFERKRDRKKALHNSMWLLSFSVCVLAISKKIMKWQREREKKTTSQVNICAFVTKLCWHWLKYMENISDIFECSKKKDRQQALSAEKSYLFI